MFRRIRRCLGSSAIAVAMLCSGSVSAAIVEFSAGHGDIGVGYHDGEFEPHWHFGSNAVLNGVLTGGDVELEPGEAYARVPDPAIGRPAGAQWDFLGMNSGESLWFLPINEVANKPFLGLATEELEPSEWSTPITWTLLNVGSPAGAHFSIWEVDDFSNVIARMSTFVGGITSDDKIEMGAGTHKHFGYGFSQLGVYDVTFQITGTHAVDGFKSSDATFRFVVGDLTAVPEPSSLAILGLAAAGVAGYRRRQSFKAQKATIIQ